MARKTAAKKTAAKKPAAKKPAAKKPAARKPAAKKGDFAAVFARLRSILVPFARDMIVTHDKPGIYYLDSKHVFKKKPVMFAAVRLGKSYVGYYLFPVYVFPDLLEGLSPELAKRMQGKSCFNFSGVDEDLFEELAALTAKCDDAFRTREISMSPH